MAASRTTAKATTANHSAAELETIHQTTSALSLFLRSVILNGLADNCSECAGFMDALTEFAKTHALVAMEPSSIYPSAASHKFAVGEWAPAKRSSK